METNLKHFYKMQRKRLSYRDKVLRLLVNSYELDMAKFDSGVYDSLYFQLTDEQLAFDILGDIGLMFHHKMSRLEYFEIHKNEKIGVLPYGYKLSIYFLIENGLAEAVL